MNTSTIIKELEERLTDIPFGSDGAPEGDPYGTDILSILDAAVAAKNGELDHSEWEELVRLINWSRRHAGGFSLPPKGAPMGGRKKSFKRGLFREPSGCYFNAIQNWKKFGLTPVYGLAYVPSMKHVYPHAWNLGPKGEIIDPTYDRIPTDAFYYGAVIENPAQFVDEDGDLLHQFVRSQTFT